MTTTNLGLLAAGMPAPDWRIAADCNIHPAAFSMYKHGHRSIPDGAVRALAAYFDVAPEVVTGVQPPPVLVTERTDLALMPEDWIE